MLLHTTVVLTIKLLKYSNAVVLKLSLCPQGETNAVYRRSLPEDGPLNQAETCQSSNQQINNVVRPVGMNPL